MLALFDADSNALQREGSNLSHAQLYERLLSQFAEREVRKERPDLDGEALAHEVDRQLARLSIAAFAMFNRGRQWSTQSELDADMAALLTQSESRSASGSFRAPLTAAQLIVGRFFFVHQAQAIQEGSRLSAFEFLHATFGEYLVARIIASELRSLVAIEAFRIDRSRYSPPDDSYLRALLSFAPISSRATIIDYLSELVSQMDAEGRITLSNLLKELFQITFTKPSLVTLYSAYEPVGLDALGRMSTYSANLLILTIVGTGEVAASALFPDSEDAVNAWRRAAMIWRAALPEQGWLWLATSLDVRRIGSHERRDVIVSLPAAARAPALQPVDLFWTYNVLAPHAQERANLRGTDYLQWQSEAFFVSDVNGDVMAHALEPLYPKLSTAITTIVGIGDRSVSAAHALVRLWVASTTGASADELAAAYEDCIEIALHDFESLDDESVYRDIILRLLSNDRNRLLKSWRESLRKKLTDNSKIQSDRDRIFVERVSFRPI
jgi:hypothetical protein